MHELYNLVKEETCFKNMQNPSCIDLLFTNNVYAFQQTIAIYTGLLDWYKLALTVLKAKVPRSQQKLFTEITNTLTPQNLRMSEKMFLQKKILIVVLSLINNFWKF